MKQNGKAKSKPPAKPAKAPAESPKIPAANPDLPEKGLAWGRGLDAEVLRNHDGAIFGFIAYEPSSKMHMAVYWNAPNPGDWKVCSDESRDRVRHTVLMRLERVVVGE